jgi:tRNA(Ile)-lysidine synthase
MDSNQSDGKQISESYLDRFSHRIFSFSREQGLIKQDDRIIISISGGADSVCLLHVLSSFLKKIDLHLHLVHFHHGLRKESDAEEIFVRRLSEDKKVPLTVIKSNEFKGKKGMQNLARQWRQKHLEKILKKLDFNRIALGHHLDDLVETQIWRMMRGGSLFSINSIQTKNLPYIRPLIETPKEELIAYLKKNKYEWQEDLSNISDDYTRNLIRNQIIPVMKQCSGDKLSQKMLALSNDAENLKLIFDLEVPRDQYERESLPFKTLTSLNPLFACELIHRFLLYHGQNEITRENLQRMFKLAKSGKGNWMINLKNDVRIYGRKKMITLGHDLEKEKKSNL